MIDLALHQLHQSLGARFTQVNEMTAVDHYGDPLAEHAALINCAGVLDLSFRGRLCLTGSDRQRFLNGQVTNNVKDLQPGQGCYAALVNHKGKMQSDANIHALADELLLDFEPGLMNTITQRLEKYIIADDVQIVNVLPHYGLLSVQGAKAVEAVSQCGLGITPPAGAFHSAHVPHPTLGEICVVNLARVGSCGFDVFVPRNSLGAVMEKLLAAVAKVSGRACGWQALEMARIEAGIPRFGTDMDETNLAPEAGIESRAISYAKGCYTGQEVITRLRTYGQVAKTLRGLRLADHLKILPQKADKLLRSDKVIGYVTSAIFSPTLKAPIALGYVRRECNQPGAMLTLRTAEGDSAAQVVALPFTKESSG